MGTITGTSRVNRASNPLDAAHHNLNRYNCPVYDPGMATPPDPAQGVREVITLRKISAYEGVAKDVIRYGFVAFCFWCIYRSISVLAGKTTVASILMQVLANIHVSQGICLLLAGGGCAYGLGERSVRRKAIERLTDKPKKLELAIDPNRTSSNLTSRGTTRPEDQP